MCGRPGNKDPYTGRPMVFTVLSGTDPAEEDMLGFPRRNHVAILSYDRNVR